MNSFNTWDDHYYNLQFSVEKIKKVTLGKLLMVT